MPTANGLDGSYHCDLLFQNLLSINACKYWFGPFYIFFRIAVIRLALEVDGPQRATIWDRPIIPTSFKTVKHSAYHRLGGHIHTTHAHKSNKVQILRSWRHCTPLHRSRQFGQWLDHKSWLLSRLKWRIQQEQYPAGRCENPRWRQCRAPSRHFRHGRHFSTQFDCWQQL